MRTLAVVAILAACAAPPQPPFAPTPVPAATALRSQTAIGRALAAALPEAAPLVGRFRVLPQKSSCRGASSSAQGNPMVWVDESSPPEVGKVCRVRWTTTPIAPHDSRPAVLLFAISIGWNSLDAVPAIDLADHGSPGCVLQLPLDGRLLTLQPSATDSLLRQSGGTIDLTWTPSATTRGHVIRCQLAVQAPGANPAGWLYSQALELWIGG